MCHGLMADSTQGDVCIVCRSEGTPGHGPSLAVIKYNLTLYKGWLVLLYLSQYAFTLFFTEIFFLFEYSTTSNADDVMVCKSQGDHLCLLLHLFSCFPGGELL